MRLLAHAWARCNASDFLPCRRASGAATMRTHFQSRPMNRSHAPIARRAFGAAWPMAFGLAIVAGQRSFGLRPGADLATSALRSKSAEGSAEQSIHPRLFRFRPSGPPAAPHHGAAKQREGEHHETVVADTETLDAPAPSLAAGVAAARPAARHRLPAPLDVDPHQLLRRAGDDARAAIDGRSAPARQPDADGPADDDGTAAVRALLAAGRRLARPRSQAADLHRRRADDRRRRRQRAAGLVGGMAVHRLALRVRVRHRHRLHRGRQRRADRADAGRGARSPRRGARQECARLVGRRSRRDRASPACSSSSSARRWRSSSTPCWCTISASILRGVRIHEPRREGRARRARRRDVSGST